MSNFSADPTNGQHTYPPSCSSSRPTDNQARLNRISGPL
jgi:hypothetical protein